MVNYFKEEIIGITKRILKRDFSGNRGIAIKNSILQFLTSVVGKAGSLFFTLILARMLMPELFGLYSLSLSTILIFAAFTDLGVTSALIKFLSKNEKNFKKKSAYFIFIRNLKLKLTFLVSLILLVSAYFIANFYYKKPIFYALIAGSLYIIFSSFLTFTIGVFQSKNNFKYPLYKEIFYQTLRLILIPLTILFFISLEKEIFLGILFLTLSLCFLFSIFFLYPKIEKFQKTDLTNEEKKEVIKFILPLSATILTGIFFGSIDVVMLGRFVESQFLAFYQAAFALLGSVGALIPFSIVFFPLFVRLKKYKLNLALKKSVFFSVILSLFAFICILIFSSIVVKIIYGSSYLSSINILRFISILLIIDSLNAIYSNFLISQGKNYLIAKLYLISTFLNILLNFFLIKYFLQFSMFHATIGAATATILSRSFLLFFLWKNVKS